MKFLGIFAIALGLFQCASIKLDNNPPFKIANATVNNTIGGTWVRVHYKSNTTISFDSIFFQGKRAKAQLENIKGQTYVNAHFKGAFKKDFILHKEAKKEYGNKLPKIKESIPFNLKVNQAVLSYTQKNKKRYFKIAHLEKVK